MAYRRREINVCWCVGIVILDLVGLDPLVSIRLLAHAPDRRVFRFLLGLRAENRDVLDDIAGDFLLFATLGFADPFGDRLADLYLPLARGLVS